MLGIKSLTRPVVDFAENGSFRGHPGKNVPFAFIDGVKGMQMIEVTEEERACFVLVLCLKRDFLFLFLYFILFFFFFPKQLAKQRPNALSSLISFLRFVMSHPMCLNASFLNLDVEHSGLVSGVNMTHLRGFFVEVFFFFFFFFFIFSKLLFFSC